MHLLLILYEKEFSRIKKDKVIYTNSSGVIVCLFLLSLDFNGGLLDNTDSNSLPHVTNSETSKGWEFSETLNTHGLRGLEVDYAGISGLNKFGVFLKDFSGTTVHLLLDVGEFTCDVSSVAIKNGRVSVGDLSRVVHDNNLGLELRNGVSGVLLRVGSDESTTKILDGDVLYVETNVVSGAGLRERFVVHLNGLDLSNNSGGGEHGMDTGPDNSSLDTSDGNSSDTSNLVNILEGKTEGTVSGTLRGVDVVKGLKEVGSLVPGHVGGLVNHVVSLPSGDRDEGDLHGLVTDLLEVGGNLTLDLLVTGLVVLDGLVVHLVTGDDHLLDTKSVGEKGVLTGLSVLGDTGLETSLGRVDDKYGNVGLGSSGNHVLDEITVSGGINDGERVLRRLELPEGDIDGDTTLTLGLEVIKNPGVFEGSLSEFGGFLLEFLDGTLIDTSTFVDHMSSGGGLSCWFKLN